MERSYDHDFDGVGLASFQCRVKCLLFASGAFSNLFSTIFLFLLIPALYWFHGCGHLIGTVLVTLSQRYSAIFS